MDLAQNPGDTVALRLRVGDATGVRHIGASEILLAFALHAADDPEGKGSGVRVSPWQRVISEKGPEEEPPQWQPCETSWEIPTSRCFRHAFLDTAKVHMDIKRQRPGPEGGQLEETLTTLQFPLGKAFQEMKRGERRVFSDVKWTPFTANVGKQVKGSLLVELHTTFHQIQPLKPVSIDWQKGKVGGKQSDSDSDGEGTADNLNTLLAKPVGSFLPSGGGFGGFDDATAGEEAGVQSSTGLRQRVGEEEHSAGNTAHDDMPPRSQFHISAVDDDEESPVSSRKSLLSTAGVAKMKGLLKGFGKPKDLVKAGKTKFKEMVTKDGQQDRPDGQRWRQWTEVFVALNEIEIHLPASVHLLGQAARSMKKFGASHAELEDCARLGRYLADTMLYFRSEADVPKRLEEHLGALERAFDSFRSFKIEVPALPQDQLAVWRNCEDTQVDLAVLLESATMTAQQALGDYKRMHTRLELLVHEYEPVCKLELEQQDDSNCLPLLVDDSARKVDQAALPERAVQWAVDFSQMVGPSARNLEGRVRELDSRSKQVKDMSATLRANVLQCVA